MSLSLQFNADSISVKILNYRIQFNPSPVQCSSLQSSNPILIRCYCPNVLSNPVHIRKTLWINFWLQWSTQFGYL